MQTNCFWFRSMQTKTHVCQIHPGGFRHAMYAMCRMLFGIFRLHVVKMTVELYQKHKNNAFALSTVRQYHEIWKNNF